MILLTQYHSRILMNKVGEKWQWVLRYYSCRNANVWMQSVVSSKSGMCPVLSRILLDTNFLHKHLLDNSIITYRYIRIIINYIKYMYENRVNDSNQLVHASRCPVKKHVFLRKRKKLKKKFSILYKTRFFGRTHWTHGHISRFLNYFNSITHRKCVQSAITSTGHTGHLGIFNYLGGVYVRF